MQNLGQWSGRPAPDMGRADGRFVSVEPARFPEMAEPLYAAIGANNEPLWRFIPIGPFQAASALGETMAKVAEADRWLTYVMRVPAGGPICGTASFMRIRAEVGSVEVGCIVLSPALQRTRAATEAMYLMARHVFDDLGYRRYEWKCNNRNDASKRAAERLGFTFEGVFRQDVVVKGENRDTAWYSIIDTEWPQAKAAFEEWLSPENFDADGVQRRRLEDIRRALSP